MTSPLLEARHLVKRFHGIKVVDDVSFVVRPGEVVGYLGPNGSGKTTTGRMMTGLMEPSEGMVLFEGRSIGDDPVAYRRRLGYVPEEPALYSFLSGREQLQLIGRLREVPEPVLEHRLRALLQLFGLADAAEQSISAYSKGMKQKVLIIGALLHDPDVLIFGEPDSGLDPVRTSLLNDVILAMHERHKGTYMVVTHDMKTTRKVSDYVGVIWKGKCIHYSSADEAFESDNPFVRQFLAGDSAGPLGMD